MPTDKLDSFRITEVRDEVIETSKAAGIPLPQS